MTHTITLDAIYAAINPLPAKLSAKGKVDPVVEFEVSANAGIRIMVIWRKRNSPNEWDRDYKSFSGKDFDEALGKATAFIEELPSAEQARLHAFMGQLGNLIDAGRAEGIAVDFMNPLVETMKRLSENVITHQPTAGEP